MNRTRRATACLTAFSLLLLAGCASTSWWKQKQDLSYDASSAGDLSDAQQADVLIALARSAEQSGDMKAAVQGYTRAVQMDATRADAYHRLALLTDKQGDAEKARELYLKTLELAPDAAEVHCDLGFNGYLRGRMEEAEQHLRRSLDLNPQLARAHNNLGLLLARSGRADEAMYEFHRAGASVAEARTNLAFAMLMNGDMVAADQQLELAATADTGQFRDRITQMRDMIRRRQMQYAVAPPESMQSPAVYQPASHEQPIPFPQHGATAPGPPDGVQ